MKTIKKINSVIGVVILGAALMFTTSCQKDNSISPVTPSDLNPARKTDVLIPPHSYGYATLSVKYWKWGLALPLENHPFLDDPDFDVTEGQEGPVWFLAATFGTVVRNVTIPAGKSVFVGMLNNEASTLEGNGTTDSALRAYAAFVMDHAENLFASVDGTPVANLESYRVASPQFHFTAPSPWIFGQTGGSGKSVADGYFLLLSPMSAGSSHTLHYGGDFHFSVAEGDPFDFDAAMDMTYNLTVQ